MKNPSRALSLGLSSVLLLANTLPVFAAGIGKVSVVVPSAAANVGVAGASLSGARLLTSTALSLSAPSLAPSAASLTPALPGAVAARAIVAPAAAITAAAANDGVVAAPRAVAAPAAIALQAANESAASKPVIVGVESAVTEIQSAKENGAVASPAVLGRLFDGFETRRSADDGVAPLASQSAAAPLAPASAKTVAAADGPRWVFEKEAPQPGAKSSWKRSFSVGLLGAIAPLVITAVIVGVAQALGYQLHPNYASPAAGLEGATPSLLQAGALFVAAAVMAPIAEEIFFRAGIQGGISKVTGWLASKVHPKLRELGTFWVPAVLGSLIFVAVHETADPVLFATRFIHAMILAYVFKKEGILASMAAHGFFNGLLTLPIIIAALVGLLPATPAVGLGLLTLGGFLGFHALRTGVSHLFGRGKKLLGGALGLFGGLMLLGAILSGLVMPGGAAAMGSMLALNAVVLMGAAKAWSYLRAQRGEVASGAVTPKPFTALHGWIAGFALLAAFSVLPNIFWLAGAALVLPWALVKTLRRS